MLANGKRVSSIVITDIDEAWFKKMNDLSSYDLYYDVLRNMCEYCWETSVTSKSHIAWKKWRLDTL